MKPSFYSINAVFWSDELVKNSGKERADFLSTFKSCMIHNSKRTIHSHSSVIALNSLYTVSSATKRFSRSGATREWIERVSFYQVLQPITTNAVYGLFAEDANGGLRDGTLDTYLVPEKNPF